MQGLRFRVQGLGFLKDISADTFWFDLGPSQPGTSDKFVTWASELQVLVLKPPCPLGYHRGSGIEASHLPERNHCQESKQVPMCAA